MTVGGGAVELLAKWVIFGWWDAWGSGGMSGLGEKSISPLVCLFDLSLASGSTRNRVYLPKFSLKRECLAILAWRQWAVWVWRRHPVLVLGIGLLWCAVGSRSAEGWLAAAGVCLWRQDLLGTEVPVPALHTVIVWKDKSFLPSSK